MYGFCEIRTDDEKYVISTLINNVTNKPDTNWCSFTIQKQEKGEMVEVEIWDNRDYLRKTFLPLLKKVYNDDMTLKQFCKESDKSIKDHKTIELFPTLEDVCQVYELFQWAKKLKMI